MAKTLQRHSQAPFVLGGRWGQLRGSIYYVGLWIQIEQGSNPSCVIF